jgi:hypothetical protein
MADLTKDQRQTLRGTPLLKALKEGVISFRCSITINPLPLLFRVKSKAQITGFLNQIEGYVRAITGMNSTANQLGLTVWL